MYLPCLSFGKQPAIISFLLVAYKYNDETARRGAFKALFITGGGGIALLIGLLFVSHVCGKHQFYYDFGQRGSSAQQHILSRDLGIGGAWGFHQKRSISFPHLVAGVPMSAPTPASAYLHSATMVKGGIYLMARLNPVLGQTEIWFWLLTLVGMATMLAGAYLGLKQNDLKSLLAYCHH